MYATESRFEKQGGGMEKNRKKRVEGYPCKLVKWVFCIVSDILDSRVESDVIFDACRLAAAIVSCPDRFGVSDYISLVFITSSGIPCCGGYAGSEYKTRVSIRPTGVDIYWDNEDFDTFISPGEHRFDKGHWKYTSGCKDQRDFEVCRDNHFFCCKTLSSAVVFAKGRRKSWSLPQGA